MITVEHLNAGWLHSPPSPRACCHCLLLRSPDSPSLTLVDTGIGLADCLDPVARVGRPAIDAAGFQFNPDDSALRQLERRHLDPTHVRHILLTHLDPDHAGGLADFPHASVHLSPEELAAATARPDPDPRYRPPQFSHNPNWVTHPASPADETFFGLPARPVHVGLPSPLYLIPLPGHTLGHCGVAIPQPDHRWTLHVGDAYYLRAELTDPAHPVSHLAAARAADDAQRLQSLTHLRRLARDHADQIHLLGYHDTHELPL